MSKQRTELCIMLVQASYGQLGSHIFSTLANYGRQSLVALRQRTLLPIHRLRLGIGILVQHHLVLHHCDYPEEDDYWTFFEVDVDAAYSLLRARKLVKLVKDREGDVASTLIGNLLQLGHASIGDLAAEYVMKWASKADSATVNGEQNATGEGDTSLTNGETNGNEAEENAEEPKTNGNQKNGEANGTEGEDKIEDPKTNGSNGIDKVARLMTNGISHDDEHEDEHDHDYDEDEHDDHDHDEDEDDYDDDEEGLQKAPSQTMSLSDFHTLMRTLLKKGYLAKVGPRSYIPEADLKDELMEEVIKDYFPDRKITGPKKGQEYQKKFNSLKRKYDAEDAYQDDEATHGTIKRARRNGDLPNGDHDGESVATDEDISVPRLPDDMVVRVDFDKCTLVLRTLRLEKMAKHFVGAETAAVYGAVLRSLEDTDKFKNKQDAAKGEADDSDDEDEDDLPTVSDATILEQLDASVDLMEGIEREDVIKKDLYGTNAHNSKAHAVSDDEGETETAVKAEEDDDDNLSFISSLKSRNHRLTYLNDHLNILSECGTEFVRHDTSKHESSVDITTLIQTLILTEIDTIVGARFGKLALRMIRILHEKGKISDAQIPELGMLDVTAARAILTKLQKHGIVDIQECPKDTTRQPAKTFYLYSFEPEKAQAALLEKAYRTMTRLLQRIEFERNGKWKNIIEKAEKAKLRGTEDKLRDKEKAMLKEWQDTEELMMVQVGRCDDLVAVFRDFEGKSGAVSK